MQHASKRATRQVELSRQESRGLEPRRSFDRSKTVLKSPVTRVGQKDQSYQARPQGTGHYQGCDREHTHSKHEITDHEGKTRTEGNDRQHQTMNLQLTTRDDGG